jgi:hypothetical protein
MDKSFLSDPGVIAASRKFVCIRLISYENKEETAFLKSFNVGRSGDVENTVFCILSPDGTQRLSRASRGTNHVYSSSKTMADNMVKIALQYPGVDSEIQKTPAVPYVADLRLALNVAGCDKQPLVIVNPTANGDTLALEKKISAIAWSNDFLGKFIYVKVRDQKELALVNGAEKESQILVVQPDNFGLKGEVLFQTAEVSSMQLRETFNQGLSKGKWPTLSFWNHVQQGHQKGVFWETKLPVTDRQELSARERARAKNSSK